MFKLSQEKYLRCQALFIRPKAAKRKRRRGEEEKKKEGLKAPGFSSYLLIFLSSIFESCESRFRQLNNFLVSQLPIFYLFKRDTVLKVTLAK